MKTKRFLLSGLVALTMAAACEKEPVTKPVDFTGTSYKTLGDYDPDGRPVYLVNPPDQIPQDMITYINSTLVEKSDLRTTRPELLSTTAIADIPITKTSDVYITYVFQNTQSSNALAFYTYPTNKPLASSKDIDTITYIFPSAGVGNKLKAGDKVKIGTFQPGQSIGFVLMKGAWNGTTKTLNNGAVHFCSNDVLNPEVDPNLKKHAVLINYQDKVLIGFENTDRTEERCDHDFNDVVIYATVK